jgi:hypothetical protein
MMVVQTPSPPSEADQVIADGLAGVIEDARTRQRKYRKRGAAVAAAAITTGALIVCFGGAGGSGAELSGTGHAEPGPSASFRLLRTPQTSSPPLPQWLLRSVSLGTSHTPSPEKEFGLDIPAARGTRLAGGVKVWLIPGRSGSCIATGGRSSMGSGCGPNDAALFTRGSEQYWYYQNGTKQRIVGIAPDQVHVTFQLRDGASIPARLNAENAYLVVRPAGDPVTETIFTRNGRTISKRPTG